MRKTVLQHLYVFSYQLAFYLGLVKKKHVQGWISPENNPHLPGPLQLVKTEDLDSRKNYVFGFHPHGILVAGAFTNFCTQTTGFRSLFPGLTPHLLMLPLWFRAPFFRDYIMFAGGGPHLGLGHRLEQHCFPMS